MEKSNLKYMLALENRPFDYMPIDLSLLDIGSGINYNTFQEIDSLTKAYTKAEILNSIERSNTITDEYINGDLIIIQLEEGKSKYIHKHRVITYDFLNNFDIISFIYGNFSNKALMNSIIVKVSNLVEDDLLISSIKEAYQSNDMRNFIKFLYILPYDKYHDLTCYILDKYHQKEDVMTRKKVA